MTYTIKLDDGKYTIMNHDGTLEFLRHGEIWPAADDLRHAGVVLAMAHRIEELETGIRAVTDGTPRQFRRYDNVMKDFDIAKLDLVDEWETALRKLLDQT